MSGHWPHTKEKKTRDSLVLYNWDIVSHYQRIREGGTLKPQNPFLSSLKQSWSTHQREIHRHMKTPNIKLYPQMLPIKIQIQIKIQTVHSIWHNRTEFPFYNKLKPTRKHDIETVLTSSPLRRGEKFRSAATQSTNQGGLLYRRNSKTKCPSHVQENWKYLKMLEIFLSLG